MSYITIIISNMNGRKSNLAIWTTDTISRGKELYGQGDPQWKYDGEVLKNDKKFSDYGIEKDDIIISNDRSRGGNKKQK